jgi:hypothetical protein
MSATFPAKFVGIELLREGAICIITPLFGRQLLTFDIRALSEYGVEGQLALRGWGDDELILTHLLLNLLKGKPRVPLRPEREVASLGSVGRVVLPNVKPKACEATHLVVGDHGLALGVHTFPAFSFNFKNAHTRTKIPKRHHLDFFFTRPTTPTRAIESNDHCFTHPKRKRTHQHTMVHGLCKQCCSGKQRQTRYKCNGGHYHCSNACMDSHGCVKSNKTKAKQVS